MAKDEEAEIANLRDWLGQGGADTEVAPEREGPEPQAPAAGGAPAPPPSASGFYKIHDPYEPLEGPVSETLSETLGRVCKWPEGCTNRLAPDAPNARKYCDEHMPERNRKAAAARAAPTTAAPKPKTTTKSEDLDRVQANATKLLEFSAALIMMTGKDNPVRVADAIDLQGGAAQWGLSVREVAKHEAWLRKLLAGGETSERAMAWAQLAIITGTIALPILTRHKLLPEELAGLAGAASGAVAA